MTLREEVKEVIERNNGDVEDTLDVLDQMILIYSLLSTIDKKYEQLTTDLLSLKIDFTIESE